MERAEIEELFRSINVWKRGSERAPHKPLLLLYALGRYLNGGGRLISYSDIDRDLRNLLIEFGPYRKSYHPEFPFWYLQSDGIWEIVAPPGMPDPRCRPVPSRRDFLVYGARGGFRAPIYEAVVADPYLALRLAHLLLEGHFPATLHEDILTAVGLPSVALPGVRRRDPEFRTRVLRAYEYRCAVCGFDLRLGNTQVGLEAAHIMWHQAGGPDTEQNGLALCVLHHKLFDLGAFTLSERLIVMVSAQAHGNYRFEEYLLAFHGRPLRPPQDPRLAPEPRYVRWHRREVFKGPERYLAQPSYSKYGAGYAAERREGGYGTE